MSSLAAACLGAAAMLSIVSTGAHSESPVLENSPIKTIYVMQHSHLDIGYTHTQAEVAKRAAETLDHVLEYCGQYPDYKWTVESLWQLEQWMKHRKPEEIERFMSLVRAGRISLSGCYAGLHSGTMGAEQSSRHMYIMDKLRREYGVSITTAIQNDITGYSWSYPQILSKSGIKYFLTGINTFIGAGAEIPMKDRPFYWEGPDGSRVLSFICHDPDIGGSGYVNALFYYGWGASVGRAEETVPTLLKNLEKRGYPYDSILVMYGMDNKDADLDMLNGVRAWNAKHSTPKMVLATPEEFLDHITAKYGDKYPVYRGDWTGLWEQVKETLPYGSALARRTHDLLPAAETLAVLDEITGGSYPSSALDEAWLDLMRWDEHSGGGTEPGFMTRDQATEDSRVKLEYAARSHSTADRVSRESLQALARRVSGDGEGVLAWNPLPQTRSGVVRANVSRTVLSRGLDLVDPGTGRLVPYQQTAFPGEVVFTAPNVPGLGYKTLMFRDTPSQPIRTDAVRVSEGCLENRYLRVKVSPKGMITSIYDKRLRREFVDAESRFGFGQLVESDDGQLMQGKCIGMSFEKPSVTVGLGGPVAGSLVITDPASPLMKTEVTLYAGSRAMHIRHTLDRRRMPMTHRRYNMAYPLSIPDGRVLYDTPAGLLDPTADRMPKAFPIAHVHHGGDVSNDRYGMTVVTRQAFNWEFGNMNTYWGGAEPPKSTTLLVRLMRNSDHMQYKEGTAEYLQEAGAPSERVYEAVFVPHDAPAKPDLAAISGRLLGEANPLMSVEIDGGPTGRLTTGAGRLLRIDELGIAVLALKKAEDGDGYVMRLMETAGRDHEVRVSSAMLRVGSAELLDNVERAQSRLDVRRGTLRLQMKPREIATVRLRPVK